MHIVDVIFDHMGGPAEMSRALNLAPQTVHSWKVGGNIPQWRRASVIEAAQRLSVQLPPDALAFLASTERGPSKTREAA